MRRDRLLTALLGGVLTAFLAFLATSAVAQAQPPIPHPQEGREQCLLCHQVGGAGLGAVGGAGMPSTHQSFSEGLCLTCHRTGIALLLQTPTPAATPVPGVPPTGAGGVMAADGGWPMTYLIGAGALLLGSGVVLGLYGLRKRLGRTRFRG